jgi:phosphinothricin acetyltransferase
MPTSLIRSVREADLEEIRAIYGKEVLEGVASFEIEPPQIEEMRARLGRVCNAKLPYLVAELDGRIAGFAYAVPYRPRPAYRYTVENSIYVARWAQRQGIGSQLLDTLVNACESAGVRQIVAIIGSGQHTASASIRAHEKAGFHKVGTLENVGWKLGKWVDTVVMQRALNPNADNPPVP